MKNKLQKIGLIAVLAISQIQSVSADAWTKRRNDCWGIFSWRYVAESEVRNTYNWKVLDRQKGAKCSGTAQAYTRVGPSGGSPRAEAQAWRAHNRNDVWVYTNWHGYTPGYDPNILFQNNLLNSESDYGKAIVKIENDIDFITDDGSSNNVSNTFFNGYILLENHGNSDFYATYEIDIWEPLGHDDDVITEEKTIWKSTLLFTQNGVTGTGIFEDKSSFNIISTDSGTLLTFNIDSFNIDLPAGKLLEIFTRGHSGFNSNSGSFLNSIATGQVQEYEKSLLNKYHLNSFDVYPVPSDGDLKIEFSTNNNETVSIEIYDYTGKKIKTLFNKTTVKDSKNEIELNNREIPNGKYQVLVRVGNQKFVRPILIK
jgi:hypothetical protein